jgi:hypothetical protein
MLVRFTKVAAHKQMFLSIVCSFYSPSSSTMTERERYFGHFIFIARDQVPLALIPVNPPCPTSAKTRNSNEAGTGRWRMSAYRRFAAG